MMPKKKYYQCHECEAYRKAVPYFGELPEICPECSKDLERRSNCKRHNGEARNSDDCGLCKMEAKFNGLLEKPEFANLNPF